jgi:RHS repeat-associated protein
LTNPIPAEEGQTIWLARVFENNPGVHRTSGSPGNAVSSQYWAGQMPEEFGTSTPSSYIYSICANYTAEGGLQELELKGNPYMFTARAFDIETGLYYYRARYYNPYIGRFLQIDPAYQGINWYAYCGNNPINSSDPSGCWSVGLDWNFVANPNNESFKCVISGAYSLSSPDFNSISGWVSWMVDLIVGMKIETDAGINYNITIEDFYHDYNTPGQVNHPAWLVSGCTEERASQTFWYLLAIDKFMPRKINFNSIAGHGIKIITSDKLNTFGNIGDSRGTCCSFYQDANTIYWSTNMIWNSTDPIAPWFTMKSIGPEIFCLVHELQEAQNHVNGADLDNIIHGRYSHARAKITEDTLRKNIMRFLSGLFPVKERESFYRWGEVRMPGGQTPPWNE